MLNNYSYYSYLTNLQRVTYVLHSIDEFILKIMIIYHNNIHRICCKNFSIFCHFLFSLKTKINYYYTDTKILCYSIYGDFELGVLC